MSDAAAPEPWTRLCLSPWKSVQILADGSVGPCCVLPRYAGNLNTEPLEGMVEGAKFRALRVALLEGNLDQSAIPEVREACAQCPIFAKTSVSELKKYLASVQPAAESADLKL